MRRFLLSLLLYYVEAQNATLRIGVMIPRYLSASLTKDVYDRVAYATSASAILIAADRVREEHLLDGFDFEYLWANDNCEEALALGLTVDFILQDQVHVIVGPSCNSAALTAGNVATFYNVPIFFWGPTTSFTLSNQVLYPTAVAISASSYTLGLALREVMVQYAWKEFSLLYSNLGDAEKCQYLKADLEKALGDVDGVVISATAEFDNLTDAQITQTLLLVKSKARIFVICLAVDDDKRRLMLAANDNGMITEEYVYIFAENESKGFGWSLKFAYSRSGSNERGRRELYLG